VDKGLVPAAFSESTEGHEAYEGEDDAEEEAPEDRDDDPGDDKRASERDANTA
jgi:hypothetical protein